MVFEYLRTVYLSLFFDYTFLYIKGESTMDYCLQKYFMGCIM
nr:MAG TPA: hypothetical protein [Caudoviricetes sp.]